MLAAIKALAGGRKFWMVILGSAVCAGVSAGLYQLGMPPEWIAKIVAPIAGLFGIQIAGQAFEDGKAKQAQGTVVAAAVTAQGDPKMAPGETK
jgi:hypothetical protein